MRVSRTSGLPRVWQLELLLISLLLNSGASMVYGSLILVSGSDLIVQQGTYAPTLKQCFFQRTFAGTLSPDTITFSNPTGKAIKFISVESSQTIDYGGVSATIASGTLGTSATVTLQVTTMPRTLLFKNNIDVKMYCTP